MKFFPMEWIWFPWISIDSISMLFDSKRPSRDSKRFWLMLRLLSAVKGLKTLTGSWRIWFCTNDSERSRETPRTLNANSSIVCRFGFDLIEITRNLPASINAFAWIWVRPPFSTENKSRFGNTVKSREMTKGIFEFMIDTARTSPLDRPVMCCPLITKFAFGLLPTVSPTISQV